MIRRLAVLAVALAVVAPACGGDGGTASSSTTSSQVGADADRFEVVTFATSDGLTLEGRLFGAGPIWVLLGHMLPADQTSWTGFAEEAAAAGYTVLTYNNRGHGASDGDRNTPDVAADAEAALAFARSRGADRPFYFGASMNGAAAMALAAAQDLRGIAILSGVKAFGTTDGIGMLPDAEEPKLFVAASDDRRAVNDLKDFLTVATEPKANLIFDEGGHGTDMFGQNGPLLTQTLIEFLAAHG